MNIQFHYLFDGKYSINFKSSNIHPNTALDCCTFITWFLVFQSLPTQPELLPGCNPHPLKHSSIHKHAVHIDSYTFPRYPQPFIHIFHSRATCNPHPHSHNHPQTPTKHQQTIHVTAHRNKK